MGRRGTSYVNLLYGRGGVSARPHGVALASHFQRHGHRLTVSGICVHRHDTMIIGVCRERAKEARAPRLVVNPDLQPQASPRTRNSWACAPRRRRTSADGLWTVTAGRLTSTPSVRLGHPASRDVSFPVQGVRTSAWPENAQRVGSLGVPSDDLGGVIHVCAL